ncbi:phosphomannose isomerase type I [Exophiala aquamarina CBS 119918]|uniref:Mannose-6-phosphate isomerase n=1 Tax=Exophiala aquamarina CBS 119918 TaxID=1182545 RepID=A0A072PHF4_9EURO|nr:phosphomannose isomerase type I [Exophiala aquamarina CBS 119918]KEF59574.1 phosphomannose isomerase type I [Exophiala aquamarina CBS 119918]
MADSVIQLKCSCNNYPWGRRGNESLAARLCEKTNPDFKLDVEKEYAEMWMGTYPELPSYCLETGRKLGDVLDENKERLIGKNVMKRFGSVLPFLPKILSIAKALPLQIHPNKDLAQRLHEKDPDNFPDSNHKPEIAIALGRFEAFVGFKPLNEIEELIKLNPMRRFMPKDGNSNFNDETLREICRNMLQAPDEVVAAAIKELLSIKPQEYGKQAYMLDLTHRIQEQYGRHDNGILVALVCMNYLVLEAGSALYIPADGIHAYLSGNIIECMARSNNVLNTGFCPRADRDSVDLFTKTLTFKQHEPGEPMLKRQQSEKSVSGKTSVYAPPMSEFNMLVTELCAGEEETIKPVLGPSIMIVTSGAGKMYIEGREFPLEDGSIYFIGHGVEVAVSSTDKLVAYRAYAE